jgi:hypothetical protein
VKDPDGYEIKDEEDLKKEFGEEGAKVLQQLQDQVQYLK